MTPLRKTPAYLEAVWFTLLQLRLRPRKAALHGTRSCYVSRSCRCLPCRVANTRYVKALKSLQREQP